MKPRFLIILFLTCFTVIAGYAQPSTSPSVYTGVMRVKLKAEDEASIQPKRLKASPDSTVSVGIRRLDALNKRFGVSEMRRVFPDAGAYEAKHRKYGLHLWYELAISNNADPVAVAEAYTAGGMVEQAEPVYKIVRITNPDKAAKQQVATTTALAARGGMVRSASTDDTFLPRQWHYNNTGNQTLVPGSVAGADIRLFDAWNITMGSPNVIVSVVDGGVDYMHEDLAASMWVNTAEQNGAAGVDDDHNGYKDDIHGYNFYNNTGALTADDHGTHVAGTIGAVNNNSKGVAGIAGGSAGGNGVRIMSCQIFQANGSGTTATAGPAIMYAADNGAVISQNSWGYDSPDYYNQVDLDAIRYFISEAGTDANGSPRPNTPMVGGIVIFAAGNDNKTSLYYPEAFPEVVAVAAIGPDGKKAAYSNYGSWVDITAPGGGSSITSGVVSTYPGNMYGYDSGTSMACPHVSGVAALVLARYGHSTYTPDSLRYRLLLSATPLTTFEPTFAAQMGSGLLNAANALQWVSVTGVTVSPTALRMFDKQTAQLTALAQPANASDKKVIWSSDNTTNVTVSASGLLEAFNTESVSRMATIMGTTEDGHYIGSCVVEVYKDIVVPEGFSPNSDGQNDFFTMILDTKETYSLKVFDRSGQQYYESADYKNNWDGMANTGFKRGKKVEPGTYYYVLTLNSAGLAKKGYVVVRY